MRVLIAPLGSHGDTLPFVGLGLALQARGHEVRLYGNGLYTGLVTGAGLPYVETTAAELLRQALADPRATDPRAGLHILAEGTAGSVMPTFDAMARDVVPGQTLLVGSTLAFAPRLLAQVQGLPFAAVHLSPSVLRSGHAAPRIAAGGRFGRLPRIVQRAAWALLDRWLLDPAFAKPLNAIRAQLGLPPVRRLWQEWIHQATVTIGLFPPWFAPPQPDWPAQLVLTGFPLYDGDRAQPLAPELRAFLDAGPPPVVFTAGTANTGSQAFYAESAAACARLGLRGILVAQQRAQLPPALPPGVRHLAFAPFSQLLPRVAAIVHHGGIGTLSQALQAGVPQLIRPMAYDQFDNAARACRLGVARELLPKDYGGQRLDAALQDLVSDADVRANCRRWAMRLEQENGLQACCDALISVVDSGR